MQNAFHHYAVTVDDLKGMESWYGRVLGFREERRFRLVREGIEIVMMVSPGGLRLELLHRAGGVAGSPPGDPAAPAATHICFETDDVEAVAGEMSRRGVTLVQQPKAVPEAGLKNCWISDPEGNLIEFIEMQAT